LITRFGDSLKLESVWDRTVNMKLNVFYSTFTNVFYSCHVFNVFYFNLNVFLHLWCTCEWWLLHCQHVSLCCHIILSHGTL